VINLVKNKRLLPNFHVVFIWNPSSAYESQEIITNRFRVGYIVVFIDFYAP